MGLTGKHDFKGIKKTSALVIFSLTAASPLSWLTNGVLGKIYLFTLEALCNYFANKGLVLLNVGADFIKTNLDEKNLDEVMTKALQQVHENKGRLTEEQKKAIDDEVIKAFDKFVVFTKLKS